MAVPFGVSVGDFIAGIRLFKGAIESFSTTRGARADYTALRRCLNSLETSLEAANQFTTPLHQAAIEPIVAECRGCIMTFLVRIAKFDLLKDKSASTSALRAGLRKMQWSLCEKEKVQEFMQQLNSHVSALQLSLDIFSV